MRIIQLCTITTVAFILIAALDAAETREETKTIRMKVTSSAFQERQSIPAKYTCDGENISPPLRWTDVPSGTKSFALICEDPDAPRGTWTHWVVYGVPTTTTELVEKTPASDSLQNGGRQGLNDFKHVGYGGPCPPKGKPHRYIFTVYALDTELTLKPRPTKKEVVSAMQGHVLAQGELIGTYQRKQ